MNAVNFESMSVAEIEAFVKNDLKAYLKDRKASDLAQAVATNRELLKVGATVTVLSKGEERTGIVTKIGDKTMFSVQFADGTVTAKGTIRSQAIRYDKLLAVVDVAEETADESDDLDA